MTGPQHPYQPDFEKPQYADDPPRDVGQQNFGQQPYDPSYGQQLPQAYGPPHPQPAYPPPYGGGYPAGYGQLPPPVYVAQPGNGLGVAGFVAGLLGLLLCWVPVLGFILGMLGIVLGGVGISSGQKSGASTGLAVAGLVCGIVSLVPAFIIFLVFAGV